MVDTRRTLAALLALFPDNGAKEIIAQRLRDFVVSAAPAHGQIDVSASAETTINTINIWEDVAGTFELAAAGLSHDFDMDVNGRLRYTGTAPTAFNAMARVSMTAVGNNKRFEVGVGKNSVIVPRSYLGRFISTGADEGAIAVGGFVELVTNDYLTIMIRNTTDTSNATIELGGLDVFSFFD